MVAIVSTYPGGSKERVRRAGNNVRNDKATLDDYAVIETWRAAHRIVLNTFQALLRGRTRDTGIVVAQRHKRRLTIFDKLRRLNSMQLHRMDDVAGCRLIFSDIAALYKFREQFHTQPRFKHSLRNDIDKYDYIKRPNERTGYRGIHDVYEYNVNSPNADNYNGLLIEIQYRTKYQHAWATCVEMIGLITDHRPKFQEGDKRFQTALQLASEIIARTYENSTSSLPTLSNEEVVLEFLQLDAEIGFLDLLRGLNAARTDLSDKKKNMILIFGEDGKLETMAFESAIKALRELFSIERDRPNVDAVLVRAATSDEIRIAFKNYFSDAKEFIDLIDRGCVTLIGRDGGFVSDEMVNASLANHIQC